MRNMTANGAFMFDVIERRSLICVFRFLNRADAIAQVTQKALALDEAVVKAQAAVKRLLPFKLLRLATLRKAFQREGESLILYFDQPRFSSKSRKSKDPALEKIKSELKNIFVEGALAAQLEVMLKKFIEYQFLEHGLLVHISSYIAAEHRRISLMYQSCESDVVEHSRCTFEGLHAIKAAAQRNISKKLQRLKMIQADLF